VSEVLFFIAGIGAIAGAIGVIALRNPFYSVLALVFHLLSLAALFLLLRAEFLAAAQVVVFAGALLVELCIAILGSGLSGIDREGAPYRSGFGSPAQVGQLLLTKFLLAFEVASYLLLVAAVGAVVLARRRRGLEPGAELAVPRPADTGTMAEAVGRRGV